MMADKDTVLPPKKHKVSETVEKHHPIVKLIQQQSDSINKLLMLQVELLRARARVTTLERRLKELS